MIVCKFGGTSVGTVDAIRRLVGIVRDRRDERPVVVVSALSGVTDQLLALCQRIPPDRQIALTALVARHEQMIQDLELPLELAQPLRAEAEQIRVALDGVNARPVPARVLDFVTGHGELWSSRIVAAALEADGIPSAWVDIRPILRTDDRFTAAIPEQAGLSDRAALVLGPIVSHGRVPVTQGFLGATGDGRPTTLGRGGSDFTATLLGAALDATRVEIWTDVDGILTADPRIVPTARVLPVASHHEAAELAAFGAKVLHPATQAPLVAKGIPCVVLNSFAPSRPGTRIVAGARPAPVGRSPVRAISCKRGVTVLSIRSPVMLGAAGFLRRLFEVFEGHGVSVDVVATSEVSVSVTIDEPAPLDALLQELRVLGEVAVFPGRAIVAVVGIDLRETSGIAGRLFGAVGDINIEMISQGASTINVTFVVREDSAYEAVRRLHDEFFDQES